MITNGDYPAAKHNCVMNVPRPIQQSAHAPRSLHLDAWAHAGMDAAERLVDAGDGEADANRRFRHRPVKMAKPYCSLCETADASPAIQRSKRVGGDSSEHSKTASALAR